MFGAKQNNVLLFSPFVHGADDCFVPCFAFVLCIMFYMDHKPNCGIRIVVQSGLGQSMKLVIGKSIDALLVNWHRLISAN